MSGNKTEGLWRTRVKLQTGELEVFTTDCLCEVTLTAVNFVSGDSLAVYLGEADNESLMQSLSPDLHEFIVKVEKRFGERTETPKDQLPRFNVWDTVTASRLLLSYAYPTTPVRNLSIEEIVVNSTFLDYCIDCAFDRSLYAQLYMQTRTVARMATL